MLQDSTEEQSSKRGRYDYREGCGPSGGQPPPSYSAQRVSLSSVKLVLTESNCQSVVIYLPHFFSSFDKD